MPCSGIFSFKAFTVGRRLLGFKQRPEEKGLKPEERRRLQEEIAQLEKELGMD